MKPYNRAYISQKGAAKTRGIQFLLTYDEWVAWWGDDIKQRGQGKNKLQMQRYGDIGAYEIGNIKKGYPSDNGRTMSKCSKNRRAERNKEAHQKHLDALMFAASKDGCDEKENVEYSDLEKMIYYKQEFAIDRKISL